MQEDRITGTYTPKGKELEVKLWHEDANLTSEPLNAFQHDPIPLAEEEIISTAEVI
jgi:hypothetical protein